MNFGIFAPAPVLARARRLALALFGVASSLAGLVALPGVASAVPYVDQSNTAIPTMNLSAIRDGHTAAQTFTVGFPGTLTGVSVVVDPRGTPVQNLTLEVQATTGGAANGTVLASASVPPFGGPNPLVFFDVSASGLSVTAGQVLAFVLKSTASLGNDYLARAVPGNTYTRGQFTNSSGAFASGAGWDAMFKTHVQPASLPGAGASDQVNSQTPTGNFAAISTGSTAAQTFTVGTTGALTRIDVTIDPRSPVLDLVMEVQATSGGAPNGTVLASASLAPFGGTNPTVTFDFSPYNLPVASGQVLAFVLRSNAAGGTDYLARAVPGNTYPGGQFTNSSGSFASGGGWDAIFQTFVSAGAGAGYDDTESSLGRFRIIVEPRFWFMMAGYPGYSIYNGLHRLISPPLHDRFTLVGRSAQIAQGDASDIGGVAVGTAGTIVSDASFTAVPPGFHGVPGTPEVHTELRRVNMLANDGSGTRVRVGTAAPTRPLSVGEIQGPSGGSLLFPANSFFDVFAEVDLPLLGGNPGLTTLRNTLPLVVETSGITSLPPKVIYRHRHTGPVPVVFRDNDTHVPSRWNAGDRFGMLVLAGHGFRYDTLSALVAKPGAEQRDLMDEIDDFLAIVDAEPEMTDSTTRSADALDAVTFADGSAFVDPAYRDSLTDGLDDISVANRTGGPCAAMPMASYLLQRVDASANPPDWVLPGTLQELMYDQIHALAAELQTQANSQGGCLPLAVDGGRTGGAMIQYVRPNPTAQSSVIEYAVARAGRVELAIYDLGGRLARTLVGAEQTAGTHRVTWDGRRDDGTDAAGGIYFARLRSAGVVDVRRIALAR